MSDHTPGPWHVGCDQDYQVDRYAKRVEWARVRGADGQLIAEIASVHPKGERQSRDFDIEASNVCLIAAAPDMLAALQEAINGYGIECNCGSECDGTCTNAKVRAVIAKAKGEQP